MEPLPCRFPHTSVKPQIYESLDHLRKQRNRVHIHDVCPERLPDREAFQDEDLNDAKGVLYQMLSSIQPGSQSDANILGFLKQADVAPEIQGSGKAES